MQLVARFPKVRTTPRVATFEWSDGLRATTPVHDRWTKLPHDLGHYVVDAYVQPPYGFWSMAHRQAPFESLTPVGRAWPQARVTWFERVKRKHHDELVQAEAIGVVDALAEGRMDLRRDAAAIRRNLTRTYALSRESAFAGVTADDLRTMVEDRRAMERAWEGLPVGGELRVTWPPPADRRARAVRSGD